MSTTEVRKPDGSMAKFWIVGGKPNMEFNVPSRSRVYRKYKEMSENELQSRFPHMKGAARPELAYTRKSMKAMTFKFDEHGEYFTEDEEVARFAEHAAKQTRNSAAGLSRFSLPFTSQEPLFEEEDEEDEEEALENETPSARAKNENKGGRGKKSELTGDSDQ